MPLSQVFDVQQSGQPELQVAGTQRLAFDIVAVSH